MNLLFYVPQMASYGGMERHVCMLAEEAAARGHRVRLLTTSNSLNTGDRNSLASAGVDFRELPRSRDAAGRFAKLLWLWRETLRARRVRWDIIYTNGQSALASTVWRAARSHTRVIHHHHTAADPAEQSTWSPAFVRVLTRAPELVACSESTRDAIARAVNRRDTRFLPYFTACPVARESVVDRRYEPAQTLHFGFVGRLVTTKGIDTLCALSRRPELSGIAWHVHGSGPDYPAGHFRAYPAVRFHGPYRDLAHYGQILQRLDAIALFTRHNEGMPLSLIESLSAGLPWVATDRGGTREIAGRDAGSALIPPPADLPAALDATLALAARIRNNTTSRAARRADYDARFAP
ncbi:glycosyl transferase family 1, partial [Termitidicoccus mucosus]